MLKRSIVLLVVCAAGLLLAPILFARPSVARLAEIASIRVSAGTVMRSFERTKYDGKEPDFVASLSVPEGGAKFCGINALHDEPTPATFLKPGDAGYDTLYSRPGLCYGHRDLDDRWVYIVVREQEMTVYVSYWR